jgi:hypothetical protein
MEDSGRVQDVACPKRAARRKILSSNFEVGNYRVDRHVRSTSRRQQQRSWRERRIYPLRVTNPLIPGKFASRRSTACYAYCRSEQWTRITEKEWELPGLRVAVVSDAKNFSVEKAQDGIDVIYAGMSQMKLAIKKMK